MRRRGPTVRLTADDATFVRAPESLVYRRLTDLASWPTWWSGCEVAPMPSPPGSERFAVRLATGAGRRLACTVRPHGWRHDLGVVLALTGDLDGRGELWLEPTGGGTVVHHVLSATTPLPRPGRVLAGYRRAVRVGLWGLKDLLQVEVRTAVGLQP
ncbi:MAG: SRPBCC family protein [Nitriliruptoraceae bacterium]